MAMLNVKTSLGEIEGLYAGNNRISVFKGIPYGKPPVGEYRWRAPRPVSAWETPLKAYDYSKIPVQPKRPKGTFYQKLFFPEDLPQSEDCLYLNVWTPANSPEEKLPVAFWIYGGGFTTGYSQKIEFDGEAFAKRGCVFVSINYRVGLFGFLAHPELAEETETHTSGNYGLMDQILALKWVKEHIGAFGGDPDNITIFGQSAGAMSCMYLSCTDKTKGLFNRAIMESCGGPNIEIESQTLSLPEAEKSGSEMISKMGYNSIKEARNATAQELINKLVSNQGFRMMMLTPIVDREILKETVFDCIVNNRHHQIQYMIGSVANEGYGFHLDVIYNPEQFEQKSKLLFGDKTDDYLKAIDYDPNGTAFPTDDFGDNMLSAGLFWDELELMRGGKTSYHYYFTKTLPGEESGAFHSCEHAYIFQTLQRFDLPYKGSDFELSNMMCDYWTNFIKSGNPNGEGLPNWNTYNNSAEKIMELGERVQMIDTPDRPGAKFIVEYLKDKIR